MDHNDPPEVIMLGIEQVQLFFQAYSEGSHEMTNVQLRQDVEKLSSYNGLYGKAMSI